MSGETTFLIVLLFLVIFLSLLRLEKIVKFTFGIYLVFGFSFAFGYALQQGIDRLSLQSEASFLGIKYVSISHFLTNAYPTLVLLSSLCLLFFFVQYSHLHIRQYITLFEKKMYTIVWSILGLSSCITRLYLLLVSFESVFSKMIFSAEELAIYLRWMPLFSIVSVLGVFVFALISPFSSQKEPSIVL